MLLKKHVSLFEKNHFSPVFSAKRAAKNRLFIIMTLLLWVVGVPKEIKPQEGRVSLTPFTVSELIKNGTKVVVQTTAGEKAGYSDEDYTKACASVVQTAAEVWGTADLIVKVKEPMQEEYNFIRSDHLLFTFLHLASNKLLVKELMKSGVTAIAYETIVKDGRTVLLEPSSIIAGILAAYQGAFYLKYATIGKDKVEVSVKEKEKLDHLLDSLRYSTLFDKPPYDLTGNTALVLGGGVAGKNASMMLAKMGAKVYILQREGKRIPELKLFISQDELKDFKIQILETPRDVHDVDITTYLTEKYGFDLTQTEIIIGAAYTVGRKAALIIDREDLKKIRTSRERVIVDISIDQGGNIYSSRVTTHKDPVFIDEFGNIRYGVTNMPGRVPRISTTMLERAIFPYVLALSEYGIQAIYDLPELKSGINVINGKLVNKEVADSLDLPYTRLENVIPELSVTNRDDSINPATN